jgi:hypothetical protein
MRSSAGSVSSHRSPAVSSSKSIPPHRRTASPQSNEQSHAPSQVLDGGSGESIPTNPSTTANVEGLPLSGTLAPALRRVHAVVARIQRRLSDIQPAPGTPAGDD